MAEKRTTRRDVLRVCVQKCGMREGRKVAQFIFEWEMVVAQVGHKISPDEFAAWWRDSRSQAYARLARFRAAFPELGEHGKPDDLMTLRAGAHEVETAIRFPLTRGVAVT